MGEYVSVAVKYIGFTLQLRVEAVHSTSFRMENSLCMSEKLFEFELSGDHSTLRVKFRVMKLAKARDPNHREIKREKQEAKSAL